MMEESHNCGNDFWLPLEKYQELGMDEKICHPKKL
jgi:hypothetical protein